MTKSFKGSVSLFIVAVLYGLYGVYARKIGLSFGVLSQNWIRNLLVASIILLYAIIFKKQAKAIRKSDWKWIFSWTGSGAGVMVLMFIAFNNLPIGTSYFLLYSTMITTGFLSGYFLFKEKINTVKIASLVLVLVGLLLIYSVSFEPDKLIYILLTLVAGILSGLWNTLSKTISHYYPNWQMVFMDALATFLVSLLAAFLIRENFPTFSEHISWLWLIIYALTQVLTVGLIVYGFKNLEAQIGSVILPMEVIFATVFAYLFYQEILPVKALAGGVLIACAAVLPNIFPLKRSSP